jgi:hypothetical protein
VPPSKDRRRTLAALQKQARKLQREVQQLESTHQALRAKDTLLTAWFQGTLTALEACQDSSQAAAPGDEQAAELWASLLLDAEASLLRQLPAPRSGCSSEQLGRGHEQDRDTTQQPREQQQQQQGQSAVSGSAASAPSALHDSGGQRAAHDPACSPLAPPGSPLALFYGLASRPPYPGVATMSTRDLAAVQREAAMCLSIQLHQLPSAGAPTSARHQRLLGEMQQHVER